MLLQLGQLIDELVVCFLSAAGGINLLVGQRHLDECPFAGIGIGEPLHDILAGIGMHTPAAAGSVGNCPIVHPFVGRAGGVEYCLAGCRAIDIAGARSDLYVVLRQNILEAVACAALGELPVLTVVGGIQIQTFDIVVHLGGVGAILCADDAIIGTALQLAGIAVGSIQVFAHFALRHVLHELNGPVAAGIAAIGPLGDGGTVVTQVEAGAAAEVALRGDVDVGGIARVVGTELDV